MFSPQLEEVKNFVEALAQKQGSEIIVTEHLLFGLLKNQAVKEVLTQLDVNIKDIEEQLSQYFVKYIASAKPINSKPQYSATCEHIFRRALFHLQAVGKNGQVECVDVLEALMSDGDSYAVQLLAEFGLTRLKLRRYLSQRPMANKEEVSAEGTQADFLPSITVHVKKVKKSPLITYAQNLNEKAKEGKTDPLIGRENEIERVAQILCRRRKNNPLLVGDPGVGKTAIAEGLAWLIVNGNVATPLKNAVVYSLDLGALVAGTKYRGDFESRMKELLDAIKKQPDAILFIDEIHSIIGAGSSMDGSMDVSNLIKPALANGELRCIGSTTFEEFRQIFEKDHALSRRFQKIDVKEPTTEESIGILNGLKSHYEDFHKVNYTDEAIRAAVELSVKHVHDRFLPDKAIDVIDEAGSRIRLTSQHDRSETKLLVDVAQIETVIASIARIPPKSVSSDDLAALSTLKDDLKNMVFGQDEAIDKLTDAIMLSRAGLKSAVKPIGSFMFAGPTGVGKTEIARQLAFTLGIPFIRFDMSEYMEAHSVSRLIGSPPGYVGHDKGGLLTEKIHQTPHAVLLLDELEKAHTDIYNILLQVMDYGKLTDNNGREVSFRQVILIMTTNVGADSISRNSMGFTEQNHADDNGEAMKRTFSPEFRNRLDAIVQFAPLNTESLALVVDKFLVQLQAMLNEKNVVLSVSDTARAYLAKKGYDPVMGARPMARLIDDELKKPLAHEILFGQLKDGGQVIVDEVGGALVFEISEPALA